MEYVSGNVFIRQMEGREGFEAGHVVSGHTHKFDHTTILFSGRWRVRKWLPAVKDNGEPVLDGNEQAWLCVIDREIEGPWSLLIEANAKHEFTFLGFPVPEWMEVFLAKLAPDDAAAFRDQHNKSLGKGWCVYSHRTPQGDIAQEHTGWHEAYR